MRTVVLTSNGYMNVLLPFSHFWLKFSGISHPVTVACYEADVPPLPANFTVQRVGVQAEHTWSSGLRMFLENYMDNDPLVLMMLEDYLLTQPVNWGRIRSAKVLMEHDDRIGKFDLSDDRIKLSFNPVKDEDHDVTGMIESDPTSRFQTSTQAAIWRVDLLLELLNDSEDAWTFERLGTDRWIDLRKQEFSAYGQGLYSRLLGFQVPPMFYANAVGGEGHKPGVIEAKHMPQWQFEECLAKGWAKRGER